MKRLFALAFAAATVLATPSGAGSLSSEAQALGSGKLIIQTDDAAKRVHAFLAFRGGSFCEPADRKGVAHVLGRLIAESEVATWIQENGGTFSVEVNVDALQVAFTCPDENLTEAARLLGERLGDSDWEKAEVERVRARLAAEVAAVERTAAGRAERVTDELTYGRFSEYYRVPLSSEVARISRSDVATFQADHVGANRLVCGVRANAKAEDLAAAVRAGLGDLEDVGPVPPDPVRPYMFPTARRVFAVDVPDAEETEIRIVGPGLRRAASTLYPLDAWSYSLAGGDEAPLQELMVAAGMAEKIEVGFDAGWVRPGVFRAAARVKNEGAGRCLEVLTEILQESRHELEREALKKGKEYFNASEAMALADPATSIRRAVNLELFGLPSDWYERHAKLINASKSKITLKVVRAFMKLRGMTIVVAGPADEIRQELEYFADTVGYESEPRRDPEAFASAQALLASMGGRDAWARFRGAEIVGTVFMLKGKQFDKRTFHSWSLVDSLISRAEHETLFGYGITVIDGKPGWIESRVGVSGLTNDSYGILATRNRRWLCSLLHRLALDDKTLGVTSNDDGHLVFSDRIGEIATMELDEDNRPSRMAWTEQGVAFAKSFEEFANEGDLVYAKRVIIPFALEQIEADVPQVVERFIPIDAIDPELLERPAED